MDKLRSIKIKNLDGTYTEEVPVGVSIENVDYNDNKTLKQVLGNLDITKGTVEERLNFSEMKSISYDDLKALRDGGKLVPGQSYRIIDYVCTTTQEESRAVEHPFDIIVWADDASTLNENARACKREGDEYYANCNLATWELKYCLDNDTNRFAWADSENGHGVVYYMKDDHNNECPYDFKQIQFARYKITECTVSSLVGNYTASQHGDAITGIDQQNPVWYFTFSYDPESTGTMSDSSVMEFTAKNAMNISQNIIKAFYNFQDSVNHTGLSVAYLNNIVLSGHYCDNNTFGTNCRDNTFNNICSCNTFGPNCFFNTFGFYFRSNTFGTNCCENTFGDRCINNTFGDQCFNNIFNISCAYNTFGFGCGGNTFGISCCGNTFGFGCGDMYGSGGGNTFGDFCTLNTFGNGCILNTLGNNCSFNMLGDSCSYIDISAGTSRPQSKQYYHILSGVAGTNSSRISIDGTSGNTFVTYVGINSAGELKTWVPADLVPAEETPTPTTEG